VQFPRTLKLWKSLNFSGHFLAYTSGIRIRPLPSTANVSFSVHGRWVIFVIKRKKNEQTLTRYQKLHIMPQNWRQPDIIMTWYKNLFEIGLALWCFSGFSSICI